MNTEKLLNEEKLVDETINLYRNLKELVHQNQDEPNPEFDNTFTKFILCLLQFKFYKATVGTLEDGHEVLFSFSSNDDIKNIDTVVFFSELNPIVKYEKNTNTTLKKDVVTCAEILYNANLGSLDNFKYVIFSLGKDEEEEEIVQFPLEILKGIYNNFFSKEQKEQNK